MIYEAIFFTLSFVFLATSLKISIMCDYVMNKADILIQLKNS